MEQPSLHVDKPVSAMQAELECLRRKHSLGIAKKLGQIKTLRTALLKAEVNGGKVHVKPHVKSRPARRQASFDLVAA